MLHALLYIGLCCAPFLVLLPVWRLDREPDNGVVHEQGDDREDDTGAAEMTAAA